MKLFKKFLFTSLALVIIASGVWIVIAGGGGGGESVVCAQDPGSCVNLGLVGYWAFEEGSGQTTADLSGNSNDGTLGADANPGVDDPKWTTAGSLPRDAVIGGRGALDFDGSNDYVDLGKGGEILSTDDLTVSVWVKPDDVYREPIIHKAKGSGASPNREIYYLGLGSSNQPFFKVINTVGTSFSVNGAAISTGNWYHIVGTIQNNVMKFYINSEYKGTATITGTRYGSDSGFDTKCYIGEVYPASTGDWCDYDGLIDDVRIYNRALSPEEIRYLYNRGGPVLHYKFDEGSGTTAHDEVGNVDAAFPGAGANQPSWSSP